MQVVTSPQPGVHHRDSFATVRKDQITHIVKDQRRKSEESDNLYDFYIHFTSGYVLLVDGLLTKLDIEDVWEWLNT